MNFDLSLLLFFGLLFRPSSPRQISICRACEKLAEEVEQRIESTGKKEGKVTVGHRFGPNGESVHKKVIDYVDSENRFLDIFEDSICSTNPHKNECYEIFDDNEGKFHDWFFDPNRASFIDSFCFGHLKGCSRAALIAADTKDREEKEAKERKEQEEREEKEAKEKKEQEEKENRRLEETLERIAKSSSSDQGSNQIVMNPDAELKAAHPEIYENLQKTQEKEASKWSQSKEQQSCHFSTPKDLFWPAVGSISIMITFAIWCIILANRREAAREPLQRPKRRDSYKIL